MNKKYKVKSGKRAVRAWCSNPRARCPLYNVFTPLPNLRVSGDRYPSGIFLCNIVLRGTDCEIKKDLPRVKGLVKQVCQNCQDTMTAISSKSNKSR